MRAPYAKLAFVQIWEDTMILYKFCNKLEQQKHRGEILVKATVSEKSLTTLVSAISVE